MARRKFEDEVVVEEDTAAVEETIVEDSPDQHDAFITILVDMGLSAEAAEAVHSMAMDLIDAGGSEEKTEEVNTEEKIEASRQRRSRPARTERRSEFAKSARPTRRKMSEEEKDEARKRNANRRLRRQNIELRQQLRELGASPAAPGLRNSPNGQTENFSSTTNKAVPTGTAQALDMIKNFGK